MRNRLGSMRRSALSMQSTGQAGEAGQAVDDLLARCRRRASSPLARAAMYSVIANGFDILAAAFRWARLQSSAGELLVVLRGGGVAGEEERVGQIVAVARR